MPGSIRVSVVNAFDLPDTNIDDKDVAVKVSIGMQEYMTELSKVVDGKTTPWNADFVFPVLNLRDNLLVELVDDAREIISKNEISTAAIVEGHVFDVDLALDRGGKINLRLKFMLTEEERQRIDMMRAAALKRREEAQKKKEADSTAFANSKALMPMNREKEMNDSVEAHIQIGDKNDLSSSVLQGLNSGGESKSVLHKNNHELVALNHDRSDNTMAMVTEVVADSQSENTINSARDEKNIQMPIFSDNTMEETVSFEATNPSGSAGLQTLNREIAQDGESQLEFQSSEKVLSEALVVMDERDCKLEQTHAEDNREKIHSKNSESRKDASSKSVKEKIKAFESSKQGAVHLNKMLLQSSSQYRRTDDGKLKHDNSSDKKTKQREEEEPLEGKMSLIYLKSGDGEQPKGVILDGETSSVENEDHSFVRKAMEDEVLEETESGCKMEVIKEPEEERCENVKIKGTKNTPLLGTLTQVIAVVSLVVAGALIWSSTTNKRAHRRRPQKKL